MFIWSDFSCLSQVGLNAVIQSETSRVHVTAHSLVNQLQKADAEGKGSNLGFLKQIKLVPKRL